MTREEFLVWATRFPEPLLLLQSDGPVLACNHALLTLLRLRDDPAKGRSLYQLAPGSTESVRTALRLWSGSGQMVYGPALSFDGVGRVSCEGSLVSSSKDGKPAVLLVRLKQHEATAERFVTLNATIERLTREVHARKRSEEMIRVQREWLHVTLSSIGDAVIATSVEGKIEFMNGAAERLTGWEMKEAEGRPMEQVFDIYHETTGAPAEIPVHRVLKEGVVVGLANHTVLRAKNGAQCPIEDSAAPIRSSDGRLIGVVLVFHDVSEKKAAEAQLVESERRFRLWTELNVIAAGVSDLQGTFLEANDALLRLLGHTREELAGGRVRWDELTPPEYRDRDQQAMDEARQRGACQPYEKEYTLRDGRRVSVIIGYALFKARARYLHQDSDELAICYIVDISERKLAEELLERRVEERTARLKSAIADLESFSYTISHDLRAPLRAMQGFSKILLNEYCDGLNDEARRFLTRIVRSGEQLETLIRGVLANTRLSTEDYELTKVDLRGLVVEMIERYPNLTAPGVRIDVSDSLSPVQGNATLLMQCFLNLLGNAIKFVAPGTAPHVQVSSKRRGDMVRVFVDDNGVGVDPADAERIFRRFERATGAKTYEGTGLGLSVVRRAAEKMGGKVGVESTPGVGSRFWIELEGAES